MCVMLLTKEAVMERPLRDVLIFLLVLISAYSVLGLHCFHCASAKEESECETDVKELKKGVFSKFSINCSDHANLSVPYCAIEIRKNQGAIQKIIRSCSDGKTFSLGIRPAILKSLNAKTNVTVCSFYEGLACVTICDKNMCNGPKGSGTMITKRMTVIVGGRYFFRKHETLKMAMPEALKDVSLSHFEGCLSLSLCFLHFPIFLLGFIMVTLLLLMYGTNKYMF